jgi:hypothetical protein
MRRARPTAETESLTPRPELENNQDPERTFQDVCYFARLRGRSRDHLNSLQRSELIAFSC